MVEGVCKKLEQLIVKYGFEIRRSKEDENSCLIDFIHPKVKPESPIGYFASSVYYDKKRNILTTTVRSKVEDYKEFHLEYCCEKENNECCQMCRPHVDMESKIFSIEATFHENPIEKFGRLLEEMR